MSEERATYQVDEHGEPIGSTAPPRPAPPPYDQGRIGRWGARTFPNATPESILAHLREEVEELDDAITAGQLTEVAEECADLTLMLTHLAFMYRFNLLEATAAKHAEILHDQWVPVAGGYHKRVKPIDTAPAGS